MKKAAKSLLAILLSAVFSSCTNNSTSVSLVLGNNSHSSSETIEESVIDYGYIPAQLFSIPYDTSTLFPVEIEEGFTYMDSSGMLVNPQVVFAGADYFSDGYALVRIEKENPDIGQRPIDIYFYIDEKLNMAFGEFFAFANPFSEGQAIVTGFDGTNYTIDTNGKKTAYDSSVYPYGGEFSENRIAFSDAVTRKFGYLNEHGQIAVPADFSRVWQFSEGLAATLQEDFGAIEYIDVNGTIGDRTLRTGWNKAEVSVDGFI